MQRINFLDLGCEEETIVNYYPSMEDDLINESLRLKQLLKMPKQPASLFSLKLIPVDTIKKQKIENETGFHLSQDSLLSLNVCIKEIDNKYNFFDFSKDNVSKLKNQTTSHRIPPNNKQANNLLRRRSFKEIFRKQQQRIIQMRRLFLLLNKIKQKNLKNTLQLFQNEHLYYSLKDLKLPIEKLKTAGSLSY